MQDTRISIVVPVYNVAPFLKICVDSIRNQSYKNLEIILVNDGSTDNSGQLCDDFAKTDKRIKVLHKRNGGLSDARNHGTRHATGSYVIYLDSDDWLDMETCRIAYETIQEHSADMVFWGTVKEFIGYSVNVKTFFQELTVIEKEKMEALHRRTFGLVGAELHQPTRTDAVVSAWGKMYRLDVLHSHNLEFVDTKIVGSEDSLFSAQAFFYLKKVVYVPQRLTHYRKDNPNSLTKNHRSSLLPRYLNLFSHMQAFIDEKKLPHQFGEALQNRIALSTINLVLSITSPNNTISIAQKRKDIREILNHKLYVSAYRQLQMAYLPLHWKTFFALARMKSTGGILLLSFWMRKFRNN